MKQRVFILGVLFVLPFSMHAQLGSLINKAKNKVNQSIDKKVDDSIDKSSNNGGDKQQEVSASENKTNSGDSTKVTSSIISYSKFDFVAGEKVLYSEDFDQDAIGELPLNWNASGKGEVVTLENYPGKWLRLFPGVKYLSGNTKGFGENYTVEFDLIMDGTPPSGTRFLPFISWGLFSSDKKSTTDNLFLQQGPKLYNAVEIFIEPNVDAISKMQLQSFGENKSPTFKSEGQVISEYSKTFRKVAHYAIQVQKQRFRFWVNETKIFDIPRAVNLTPALNQLFFNPEDYHFYNEANYGLYISNIKIATGAADTRHKLLEEGKFSTTGILFDSGSDVIRPQSAGVLKEIAQTLKDNPSLRVKIVGHTDSDGNDKANLELSKKRGTAVKLALQNDFGIAENRLEADGKGETQPVADNKTKEGKMQNRRVEFIRL